MRAACAGPGLKGQRFAYEQILRGPVGALRLAGLFAWYAPIQGCQTQFLEGCSPAEFSSNPAPTHKSFQISLKDLPCLNPFKGFNLRSGSFKGLKAVV